MKNHISPNSSSSNDPFNLASLPQLEPPADTWQHIEAALRRQRVVRHGTLWLASAAAVLLSVGFYGLLSSGSRPAQPFADTSVVATTSPVPADRQGNLQGLVDLSQKLERNLRTLRAQTGVVPAQSLLYQVELEDLVSQVDEAINLNPDSLQLWSQRVNLLLDLNQLQSQQLRREYSQIASL